MADSAVSSGLKQIYSPLKQRPDEHLPQYKLKWRQGQLLAEISEQVKQPLLPALETEEWLVKCLKHSPVWVIRIDPELGEARLKLWANACEQANKPMFLRIPADHTLLKQRNSFSWWLKRLLDWSIAAVLLLILSPVTLGLVLLMRIYLPGPTFVGQWQIGERGKLFRLFKFRTMVCIENFDHSQPEDETYTALVGLLIRKYNLDGMLQLFNVLRGEMSLVGPRPWTLYDAVRISPEERQQLNALPGITGTWLWRRSQTSKVSLHP